MSARRWTWALAALLAACGDRTLPPSGQIVLYVDTDAPLPHAAGIHALADDPMPLFDAARIEVYRPGEDTPCRACTREIALDHERLARRQASIGIDATPRTDGYRVRVRLFRAAAKVSGEPPTEATLDTTVSLPAIAEEGIAERTVILRVDDVGRRVGTLDAPVESVAGAPPSSLVGKWSPAKRVLCTGVPRAGEVCVPGGAFWMGHPRATARSDGQEGTHPRLVVLSPFFLDLTEVTVAAFRPFATQAKVGGWSGKSTGDDANDWCTFTPASNPDKDALPLNCVTFDGAREYCRAHGGDLPTEAQFEYAAGGMRGALFVWGDDEPSCADAVWGRTGWGIYAGQIGPCRTRTAPGGLLPAGSGARDRVTFGDREILDLAGNAMEWTRDTWNRAEEPCWSRAGVFVDPVCDAASARDGVMQTARGGGWRFAANVAVSAGRVRVPGGGYLVHDVGFRCARAGQ